MHKIIISFLLIFLLSCCKKENEKTDYRDGFVGTYFCHKTGKYGYISNLFFVDTFINVKVLKYKDSSITILDMETKISKTGEFYKLDTILIRGFIVKDSLNFGTYQGGLGYYHSYEYKGKK